MVNGLNNTECIYVIGSTIYLIKLRIQFCFVVWFRYLSWCIHVIYLHISFMVISMVLGQWYNCPNAVEATLKDMYDIDYYRATTERNVWTMRIIVICLWVWSVWWLIAEDMFYVLSVILCQTWTGIRAMIPASNQPKEFPTHYDMNTRFSGHSAVLKPSHDIDFALNGSTYLLVWFSQSQWWGGRRWWDAPIAMI